MKIQKENQINSKLINHTRLKLTASLFMFLDNCRKIKTQENPFIPYEMPVEFAQIEELFSETAIGLKGILELPVEGRLNFIEKLQKAKENLIKNAEAFFCYICLNSLLAEITADYRRIFTLENSEEKGIDFHSVFHDISDFVEKDPEYELQCANISYMMKCFPLFMTKEKYNDYIFQGMMMLFENESKSYISNATRALKFRFLPTGTENYGAFLPEIKDYLGSLLALEYEKMTNEELEEILQGIDDNANMLENMVDHLSVLYESLNFAILVVTFSKDFDYLMDGKAAYKDAFYLVCEKMDKQISQDDILLSETADEMYDDILLDLIDQILEDEKAGILKWEKNFDEFSQETADLFKINALTTNIYYEMLQDAIYNVEPANSGFSEKADKEYIVKNIQEVVDYIGFSSIGLSKKTQKQLKRLFFSCIPSPFSVGELMSYCEFVVSNISSYGKKAGILENIGEVFASTGFIDRIGEKEGDTFHQHEEGCDCSHHH